MFTPTKCIELTLIREEKLCNISLKVLSYSWSIQYDSRFACPVHWLLCNGTSFITSILIFWYSLLLLGWFLATREVCFKEQASALRFLFHVAAIWFLQGNYAYYFTSNHGSAKPCCCRSGSYNFTKPH